MSFKKSFVNLVKYLYALVSVRHHGNEEIDEDDCGDEHIETEDQLEEVGELGRVPGRHVDLFIAGTTECEREES